MSEETVEGKIAAIINDRGIVINRGIHHGVSTGMVFAVHLVLAEIIDPDDPSNILPGLFFEKGRVRVSTVFDKMSYGQLLSNGTTNPSIQNALGTLLAHAEPTYPSVDRDRMTSPTDWVIRVGDTVKMVKEVPDKKSKP
jgi:hypothetical protein